MSLEFSMSGSFKNTTNWLTRMKKADIHKELEKYAKLGVQALRASTPMESGLTAASWDYAIVTNKKVSTITWTNSNIQDGVNVAVILQYGHGMHGGGYVLGRDYINPAMKPIFDQISAAVRKVVTSA